LKGLSPKVTRETEDPKKSTLGIMASPIHLPDMNGMVIHRLLHYSPAVAVLPFYTSAFRYVKYCILPVSAQEYVKYCILPVSAPEHAKYASCIYLL
jgi:hypothetical protein